MIIYKEWIITHDPKPIPIRWHDYNVVHYEYDGPEDRQCFTARSVEDAKRRIDEEFEDG